MAEAQSSGVPPLLRGVGVLLFAAVGIFLIGVATGVLPMLGGALEVPPAVAIAAGAVFLLGGAYIALDAAPARFRMLRHLVVLAWLGVLAAIFSWIAFGEGERVFSASMSAAGEVRGGVPEGEGRFMFGALAVLSYVLIAAAGFKAWRDLTRPAQ